MKVYHGSTFCVDLPLASVCRDNLDFGKGFYVTDLKEQAVSWALRIAAITKMLFFILMCMRWIWNWYVITIRC